MDDFSRINWVQQWQRDGVETDVTVWIDVAKLDRSWRSDTGYFIPPGGAGAHKYDRFGQWLAKNTGPLWMPHVSIEDGLVSFTDGRHRFAWFRDRGAKTLPVTIERDMVDELIAHCGAA